MIQRIRIIVLLLVGILFGAMGMCVEAAYETMPNISLSADKNAFTTDARDKNTQWYENGYEVSTGVQSSLRMPETGEHLYTYVRTGRVGVGKCIVVHKYATCIHDIYPAGNYYYGEVFGRSKCRQPYYSGWFAYCADCGEPVMDCLLYMSEKTAKQLTYLDLSMGYFYKCPHCDNLEQGVACKTHNCKAISANRYFVRYFANFGSGFMDRSIHMVNNATNYEGTEVTPQTKLNLNTFQRVGYEFVGWNTKKDGSGTFYEDGAEIYNLSMEENANVILYAQWKKSSSVLEIDPKGGRYEGKDKVVRVLGDYATEYEVKMADLTAPKGHTVHFDTASGETIKSITAEMKFSQWCQELPFFGKMEGNRYTFMGQDGSVDRITAVYVPQPIVLPEAVKEGYSFGGWFSDKECTKPVGMAGTTYTPAGDVTLYASWVELQLTADDNYVANQGKGAVNLSWCQKDNRDKVYQIFQRTDNTEWIQVSSAEEKSNHYTVSKAIDFSGRESSYMVPYTGFYRITIAGAKGADYGEYSGGNGSVVEGCFYLEKGDRLDYVIGGRNGYMGGGEATEYGNGGGYSIISHSRNGTMLIAGGGGGATPQSHGGLGGSREQNTGNSNGEKGQAGGGGGYRGGTSGEVVRHFHDETCIHEHIGNSSTYGGCYTVKKICGSRIFERIEMGQGFYYGNISDTGEHIYCARCGSYECPGHSYSIWGYRCSKCSKVYEQKQVECTVMSSYEPGCGKSEKPTCGRENGEILRSNKAYGGSNYVNDMYCIDYDEVQGANGKDGFLRIASSNIGVLNTNFLNGVQATDTASPDIIDMTKVCKTVVGESEIRISFEKPADNGTKYYHQVKSFSKDTQELLCISNQTVNTLTSGVVGYYYVLSDLDKLTVSSSHNYLKEVGENPFLTVPLTEGKRYLHIAAVDRAGNIGPAISIMISKQESLYWPLVTMPLVCKEGGNVFPAAQDATYYVKADDRTNVMVVLEGVMCGTAREDYQINETNFIMENVNKKQSLGMLSIYIPNEEGVTVGCHTYPLQQLQKKVFRESGIRDNSYTIAKRSDLCKRMEVVQGFCLSPELDGQKIQLIPQVAAVGTTETTYSKDEEDRKNSLYLVADAKAPTVKGIDELQNIEVIEFSEREEVTFDITAMDSGSGLNEFYVEVNNHDNGSVQRFGDDSNKGRIKLVISEEDLIFQGDFTVLVYASDHVGNEFLASNDILGVGLDAGIEKILEPDTTVFKRGESGILHIKTIGYVEKVEINYPEFFLQDNDALPQTIHYEIPSYQKIEEIPFMVPLDMPDGEAYISVKAYKSGTTLEETPQIITIKVEGSILDEIRTRLR